MTFTVTLGSRSSVPASPGSFSVTPDFGRGTATKGTDYTASTDKIDFKGNHGEKHTFEVATTEDAVVEGDETFSVTLTISDTEENIFAGIGTGTIVDDDTATVTIANASADEGDAITFTVTLDNAVAGGLTVTPSFTDGTATEGTDYTENTAGLSFTGTAGETKSFTVATTEDAAVEPDETFTVGLAVSGTSLTVTSTGTATGTIRDDDIATLTIADAWASEGAGITFTVTLDKAVSGGLTVTPSFTDVTASGIGDYTPNTAALSFAGTAGETQSFTVATIQEEGQEGDETFTVGLTVSGTTARVTSTDTATGTILDDDGTPPALTIDDASASEGDVITFTVSLDRLVLGGLTVTPSFTDRTTEGSEDYSANTAGISFAGTAGESKTFTVATIDDDVLERDETFRVELSVSGAARWVKATDHATGTIRDDEPNVTLTIEDASATEGDDITFTVTLDKAIDAPFQVHPLLPGGGNAVAGRAGGPADWDYDTLVYGLSFDGEKGETQSFTVRTNDDDVHESNETFTAGLQVHPASVRESFDDSDTATGTIVDNDPAPAVTIADASATEGDEITFTVTLDAAVSGGLTVTPGFTDGTATKGTDYTETTAPLTFAGTAGETQTFTVSTTEDSAVEEDETFTVDLTVSGTSATVTATDTATGTITDDDDTAPQTVVGAALTIADASAAEGEGITFTVTLDKAVSDGLTVTPSYTDGTATAGTDYTRTTRGIAFEGNAGETRTFTVATTDDAAVEPDETFTVSLTVSGTTATVTATDTATGIIIDNDTAPAVNLSVSPSSVSEGDRSTAVTVTAAFSPARTFTEDRTVTVSVGDGTATSGADYAAVSSFDITIPRGASSGTGTFRLRPIRDTAVEGRETIEVAGVAGGLTVNGTVLTLTDSDAAPAVNLSVSPSIVSEGDGSTAVTVTAAFSPAKTFAEARTVTVSVGGGTATSGTDYAVVSSFDVTIPRGATRGTGTFRLRPLQDSAVEGQETIDVTGGAGELTVNGAVLTLTDDDAAPAVNLSVGPSSVSEGDGSTPVTVTASFSTDRTFSEARTVTVSVGGGTATSGADYAAVSSFDITIARGATRGTGTFRLRPMQDKAVEGDETIDIAGVSGDLTVNGAALTLTDDDVAPEVDLSVGPSSVSEEDGSTSVTVTAAFSTDSTFIEDRTVTVSVGGGTATSDTDYAAVSDFDITIAGGAASGTGTFTLTPIGDAVVEGDETIDVAGVSGDLTVNGAALTLTDSTPRLGVRGARAVEGETMAFTVTLQSAGPQAVTVQYATADGTATAGADYTSTSGQLVFSGDETEQRVSVPIADDAEVEDNETLTLTVQLADAAASSASATGTILENDALTMSVTAPDVQEAEGTATFTGSLSSASPYRLVVEYATSDGTATAGADYVETTGRLVFAPGETEKAVVVPVMDDDLVEGTETLLLSMTVVPVGSRAFGSSAGDVPPLRLTGSGATGQASPTSLQVTGTIRDDELARARSEGTSPTLHLLARSMASEAVAAIGERFAATGGDAPRAGLGAAPAPVPSGQGVGTSFAVAFPSGVAGTGGAGASPGLGQGAMALHQPSDQPFADLGWLDNAYFSTPLGQADESGGWQVWGRAGTVRSRLQSTTGGQARGDVFSTHVGVDTRLGGSALVGASVSHTVGLLGYTAPSSAARGALPGEGDGSVTSVQPYAHWAPRDGLTLWGMGGGGRGSLTLADSAGTVETPLGFRLFAGGARQALTTNLALKADAFHATLRSEERADLAASTGTAIRGRMLAEGQTDWTLSESSSLNPRVEAGLRWDGGTDVEGMGAEMGVGLAYVNRRLNLGLETQGRYLVAHQADGFEEWGAGLSLRVGPGIERPGPWLALNPEWGASDSRVNALWDPGAAPGLHRGAGGAPGAAPDRIGATAGYRLSDAGGVSVEAARETRVGDGGGVAVRVAGNLSWGGNDGGPGAGGGAPHAERPAPVRRGAVAVAAFDNVSGVPADQWIGAGVTETLTSALGQLDALSVVADGEAGEAPPAWRVAGEYRRWGGRVRIDARVVDMRTGAVAERSRAEGATAELFELLDGLTADLTGTLESLSAGGGAGGLEPAAGELAVRSRDVRGSEGSGAASATRWALAGRPAGSRDAGIAQTRPSTAVRLDTMGRSSAPVRPGTVDEARPSALRPSVRRPIGSREAGIVQARPSASVRLDEARPSAPVRLDTVAIGRFRNVLQAPADDWLGVGVTETLTIALEELDAVEVVGSAGGAGPEPAWLVTGEYRRRGGRLQIDARVVDTRTGAVAARSSVEGASADFFDMQDRITADLAGALGNLSTAGEPGRREPESRAARVPADASPSPREISSLRLSLDPAAGPSLRGGLPATLDW